MIHYLIVIPLIVVIIYFQVRVFIQASTKIDVFKSIFPSNRLDYSIGKANIVVSEIKEDCSSQSEEDNDAIWQDDKDSSKDVIVREVEVSQISVRTENATMTSIKDALNMYLQKNSGAASDFALMKDVVERYCGAEEEEITVVQPIPLYMGLMGTMIGIIVGISVIAANGGVEKLTNVSSMMTCVAIAMVASLVGIVFTTIISWKAKGAKTVVESRKNVFYSWLQTELLPVLSGNTVTALSMLQTNLMTFNQTFKGNIQEFDQVLTNVRKVSQDQAKALEAISRIDITQVAQANIAVLRELQKSTSQLEIFNQYLTNVNGYLDAVNSLNNNLSSHLDRTAAIERMGSFFESEIEQVKNREEYIRQVVGSVDRSLEQSFNQMVSTMNTYMGELRTKTTSELDAIRNTYEQQQKAFVEKLKEQQEALSQKTEEMEKVLAGIQSLAETKAAINGLTEVSRNNSRQLQQIARVLDSMDFSGNDHRSSYEESRERNKPPRFNISNILNMSIKVAALIAFVLFLIEFISR